MSQPTFTERARATFRRLARRDPHDGLSVAVENIETDLSEASLPHLRSLIDSCLLRRRTVVVASARAAQLAETYSRLSPTGKQRFFEVLRIEYCAEPELIATQVDAWSQAEAADRPSAERALRQALVPPWTELLLALAALPHGVKFVVDMRADLRDCRNANPELEHLEKSFRDVLADWFDVGFIELRELTWTDTPAEVLERLIEYEAVHEISSWDDLRNRLGPDRKLFAFFHPRMPAEPLIFVEVALVSGPATNLDVILDVAAPDADPSAADTAVFYSISNCQPGLAGISFGNTLIKQVVGELQRMLPNITAFETLSPVPGFRDWLLVHVERGDYAVIGPLTAELGGSGALRQMIDEPGLALSDDRAPEPLMRACARYLVHQWESGQLLDRVARFHLANGARIERINWAANTRPAGLNRSFGMMVNYRYSLDHIEQNQTELDQGAAAASAEVAKLAGTP